MNLFFLLFVVFAILLALNGVTSIRKGAKATALVSFLAAVGSLLLGHYLFNF